MQGTGLATPDLMARLLAFPLVGVGAVVCALAGCGGSSERSESAGAAFGDRVNQDIVTTTEPGVTLFDGYNSLFDLRRSRCVEPSARPLAQVGQTFQQTTIKVIKSEVELAKELGIDATFGVKAPVVSAQGSASLLRSFTAKSSSVNYLIQAVQSYRVISNMDVNLTPEAREMVTGRPLDFLVRCGDRYVSGVTFEAKIEALLTFETSSEEQAQSLRGEISGGGTAGGVVQLEGSIKSKLTDASKRSGVSTMMTVTAQGFDVAGDDALIGLSGTVEEKLARIDVVAGNMATSLKADRDRDATEFFTNTRRSAIPGSVHLSRFGGAMNAPPLVESTAPFTKNLEMLRQTERFLRTLTQLKLKMEHAYRYEIQRFQEAGTEEQVMFNLMPPAQPKRFASELRPIATEWAARFRVDDGLNVGRDLLRVQEAIDACLENAKIGDFAACQPFGDPTSIPAYTLGDAALREYEQSGRIVKLRAFVIDQSDELAYAKARERCANDNGWADRLPTAEEAQRLAPLVAAYGGGAQKSVWTADSQRCIYDQSGLSYFANPLEGASEQGCDRWTAFSNKLRSVVCVPQSGPIGMRDDL